MNPPRKINVLMVSNYPSDTGYAWWLMEHFWVTMAELFDQNGGKAYLAYPAITSLSKRIASAPIKTIELTIPWHSKDQASLVKDFIRKNNITAIYFTDQPYFNAQYAVLRSSGVKQIIIHDHTPGDRPPINGIKGMVKAARNAIPLLTADNVLCVSELMRQRNISNVRIPAHKCITVQNGIIPVDCSAINVAPLKKSLNVKPNCTLVITTGRAHPYKRFDFIIKCAEVLTKRAPELDVVFLLVGDGPAMSELHEMVRLRNLEASVRLLGFRSDVRELLCVSDIALHAALGEGFSLSIIEYMSAGLPVLVPDIPSVCQAINHDKTGIIYPKDDPVKVAAHIQALVTNPERILTMGKTAKEQANSIYSLEQCTNNFVSAIENILPSKA